MNYGTLLLHQIVTIDLDLFVIFLKTLDANILDKVAPYVLGVSSNPDRNLVHAGAHVPDPKHLIAVLKDAPRTIIAVMIGLFFPNEKGGIDE